MQLSVQISHLSVNENFINSTVPDFTTPSFQKSGIYSTINTLWVLSLLIALITASVGILVKQWFHELLSYETHDPMERLKLRFFREAGIERWKVFAIASALPLLLQLALLLFFIGLALFFHLLDAVVAWFTTGAEILWLGFLVFATLAPAFSSQCPYKTPFLKRAIFQLRVEFVCMPWLKNLTHWLWAKTSRERFPKLKDWIDKLDDQCWNKWRAWKVLEEGEVCKDGSLSLPVISFARDLLQGERLRDSIGECIRDISESDAEETFDGMGDQNSPIYRMLPRVPDSLAVFVGSFAFEENQASNRRLGELCFGPLSQPSSFQILYVTLSSSHAKAYTPDNAVIPFHSTPAFIHLIQANPTSAAFSFLTMYSVRHRTLTDHPDCFDDLFDWFSDFEEHAHGIGKLTIPSPSPLQLIGTHRGPVSIEPTHSNKIPHPFHLEPTA